MSLLIVTDSRAGQLDIPTELRLATSQMIRYRGDMLGSGLKGREHIARSREKPLVNAQSGTIVHAARGKLHSSAWMGLSDPGSYLD